MRFGGFSTGGRGGGGGGGGRGCGGRGCGGCGGRNGADDLNTTGELMDVFCIGAAFLARLPAEALSNIGIVSIAFVAPSYSTA